MDDYFERRASEWTFNLGIIKMFRIFFDTF